MTTLPTFFIVGPPRTGTTWLHEVLKDRAVLPSSIKETRFFDHHFHRGIDWYRGHYPSAPAGRRMGEIAPTYFASNAARERIAKFIPQVAKPKKSPLRNLFLGGGSPFAELSSEISHRMCEVFRPEVEELDTILNRDLSAWKNFSSPIASPPMPSCPMPSVPTTT